MFSVDAPIAFLPNATRQLSASSGRAANAAAVSLPRSGVKRAAITTSSGQSGQGRSNKEIVSPTPTKPGSTTR